MPGLITKENELEDEIKCENLSLGSFIFRLKL